MADTKISALPAATTIGSSDVVPIVQGGATKKLAPSAVGGALFNLATPGSDGSIVYANADGTTHTELASALIINQIKDSTDPTKVAQFDASGITTGTTRTTTIPNANNVLVVPDTGASNNFLTGITAAGAITKAQPAIANVSDATTVGQNIVKLTNPSALSYVKIAANNTASTLTPAQVLSDIGAQASGSYAASGANADITSASGFTGAITTPTKATFSTGTITTSQPIFDLSQTWNASGTAFTAIKLNITNTQSASTSILQDWEVGGVSQAVVNAGGKIGASTLNGDGVSIFFIGNAVSQTIAGSVTQRKGLWQYNSFTNSNGLIIKWSSADDTTSSVDTGIARNGAGVAEVNNGTAISGSSNAGSIKALTFIPVGTATTCTGATIGTGSKSNAGFVTATTTGTSTIVITFPVTAPTGWNVYASDGTALTNLVQTASSTTTATLSGTTASGDVIRYIAMPY